MPTYTKLEYIEGTGTQYIDLGFKLSSNHAVDMDLQMVKFNANIFGSRYGAQDRAFTLFGNGSSILTDMGGTRNSTTATTDRINVYLSSSRIKIGTFEKNISSGSFTTPGNGYIFNISYSRPQSYMASMKLYGCKIYLSGTLIRDLIPCKYNNQIGLWDTINGSFLGNAGTGEFVAGPTIGPKTLKVKTVEKNNLYTKLEYIESTGTQYINTGVKPSTADTKIECEAMYMGGNSVANLFGIRTGGSSSKDFYQFNKTGTSNEYRWICGRGGDAHFTNTNLTKKTKLLFEGNKCYINDVLVATSGSSNSGANLFLFARNNEGVGVDQYGSWRLYSFKIYKNNELIRDFIPTKTTDGVICLYDLISKTFYMNSGSGNFVAGPYSLIGKIVSKINGKYAKTINGVSIQCWKKKYE